MSEKLHLYYERELLFIRQLAQEFARQYPAAASRLYLEPNRSTDPHVERLIESFALLAGRIHHKLDDEFPELTDALLSVLYPHYLAPIPSMAIVQFELDAARVQVPDGFLIDRHSNLHTPGLEYEFGKKLACRYRTGYPVTLWPVAVTSATLRPPPFPAHFNPPLKTKAALRLQLECQSDVPFAEMSLEKLRFFLSGDNQWIPTLYELLFNHVLQVVFRPLDHQAPPIVLPPQQCLSQVGFERDEGLLPYPNQAFLGYRLLTEFFAFPAKFHFLDLGGWQRVRRAGFRKKVEVVLFLDRTSTKLEQAVTTGTFRLGCTPIINLFEQVAEPIPLTQARFEYRVNPDVAHTRGMEVYSVDSITSADATGPTREYQPFYSFRHGGARDSRQAFWYASRRPALQEPDPARPLEGSQPEPDRGTDVFLNLVDLNFDPRLPAESVLVVRTTCLNRDLPSRLQLAGEELAFELEQVAPLASIRCLRSPTATLRPPPLRRGVYWRLLGHLNLNHLSLSDPEEGRESLQEILRLYDFSDPEANPQLAAVTRHLIDGILSVGSRRVVGRTGAPTASGFARGVEVTIEFDEQKYVGTGAFLFACVLERFLGLYVSINSFSQLIGKLKQGEGPFKKWPPRAGEQALL
jgi:type VI secretion system protein ImpG